MQFDRLGPVPASIRDVAVAEAARIWTPYGVVLNAIDGQSSSCAAHDSILGVAFELEPPSAGREDGKDGRDGLGVIRFAPGGAPEPSTTIYYAAITRIATSAPVMGIHSAQWPARLRDQVVARAVGRVLAHEVGHFLLRWPHHVEDGLMRGEFHASILTEPDSRAFALTTVDRARFQIVLDAALPPIAARAEGVQATTATCRPTGFETVAGIPNPR